MHSRHWRTLVVLCLLAPAVLIAGCSGDDGAPGQDGADSGILSGTVTNHMTGAPIAGATITGDPALPTAVTTDASGNYSVEIPVGAYMIYAAATDFTGADTGVSMLAGGTASFSPALDPVAPVVVTLTATAATPAATVDFATQPGSQFVVSASVSILDGSTLTANPYNWTFHGLAAPTLATPTLASTPVTLGDEDAYRGALISAIEEASMGHQPLPRFQVLPINPFALEEAGHVELICEVSTSTGVYQGVIEVHTTLPFANVSTGLRNQPNGLPVMLQAPDQAAAYDWQIEKAPTGSTATINDGSLRFPTITPIVSGEYELSAYDEANDETAYVAFYVGNWQGAIDTAASVGGRPQATCRECHEDQASDWSESGHAEIFTDQINFGGHYSTGCFPCHTVGFNTTVSNGGIDDQSDYQEFLDADYFHHNSADNWNTILQEQPNTAALANIQCENCHGPQGGNHSDGDARISLASEVCGTCHGEPPRHARYQQWLESGHANYELAVDEGGSGNCSRCHTANGFVAWGEEYDFEAGNSVEVTWSEDEVHPQTCATCHPTHYVGTTSGHGTNAPMRVMGDTPVLEAGFQVFNAGKGAQCMVCHNSRRDFSGLNSADARAPHHSNQTDMLQSLHVYFVEPSLPGKHAALSDTCVTCHVELTPPPAELSYNLGGVNHTFEANLSICSECHGAFDGGSIQANVGIALEHLEGLIASAIEYQINDALGELGDVKIVGYDSPDNEDTYIDANITVGTPFNVLHFGSSHGRQAMDIEVNGTVYYHVQLRTYSGAAGAYGRTGHRIYERGTDPEGAGSTYTVYTWSEFGETVAQAAWNFLFVEFDGSEGIHNPTFAGNALMGAINAIEEFFDSID